MKNILLHTASTLVLVSFCIVSYWLIYPYKPLTSYINPLKVTVKGRVVVYESDSYRDYVGTVLVGRTIVCGDRKFFMADHSFEQAERKRVQNKVTVTLPEEVKGECYISTVSTFQVNPLRSISVTTLTEEFTIKP